MSIKPSTTIKLAISLVAIFSLTSCGTTGLQETPYIDPEQTALAETLEAMPTPDLTLTAIAYPPPESGTIVPTVTSPPGVTPPTLTPSLTPSGPTSTGFTPGPGFETRTPTPAIVITPTRTRQPTPTPGPSPTPTPELLALEGTPLPLPLAPVSPLNAGQVSALAEFNLRSVHDIEFSPDGSELAVAGVQDISLFDLGTRDLLRTLYPRATGIVDIAFSPNASYLVSGSRLGSEQLGFGSNLELWRGPLWQPLGILGGVQSGLAGLAFSPDSRWLAVAYARPEILNESFADIWLTSTWQISETLQTGATILDLAFSRSALLAVTPDRYSVEVYNLDKDELAYRLPTSFTGAVNTLVFSPDGLILATGHYDGEIRLWDANTGGLMRTLQGEGSIESLAFTPDSRVLASGSSFNRQEVRLWDVTTGDVLRVLSGHTAAVEQLRFTNLGDVLVSGSYDGLVRLWGVRP